MTRLTPFALGLLLALCLTACGDEKNPVNMTSPDGKIILHLGMAQSNVEELLGSGEPFDWDAMIRRNRPDQTTQTNGLSRAEQGITDYSYGIGKTHLFVIYDEGQIACMSTASLEEQSPMESSQWQNGFGLACGVSKESLLDICGTPANVTSIELPDHLADLLTYYYDASGKSVGGHEAASLVIEYCIDTESNTLASFSVSSFSEKDKGTVHPS